MTNPICMLRSATKDNELLYSSVYTWCPGCEQLHPFTVKLFDKELLRPDGTPEPVWYWNQDLLIPTFSPSMLAYNSVHLCPPEYQHYKICENPSTCLALGHAILDDNPEKLAHQLPHIVEPAFGNCHSFVQSGQWQFLTDSAHALAGQTVDMVPLPDWFVN